MVLLVAVAARSTCGGEGGSLVLTVPRCVSPAAGTGKKSAKSKEELAQEKKKELEKRLQDVSGQLNNNKKPTKKGTCVPGLDTVTGCPVD